MDELPYKDTKPVGAAGFYSGINSTFRFFIERFGEAGWRGYLEELGRRYFAPVNERWRQGGLPAIAAYWRAFFAAEPGARVEVREMADRVEVHVAVCPAISHLRAEGKRITPQYCRHCWYLGAARATTAGYHMRLSGGNGSCVHTFAVPAAALPPQDLTQIAEATA